MRSFRSNENIQRREGGSYYVVSAKKASSVTRQRKPEETYCNFANFKQAVDSKTDINQNGGQISWHSNILKLYVRPSTVWVSVISRAPDEAPLKRQGLPRSWSCPVKASGSCPSRRGPVKTSGSYIFVSFLMECFHWSCSIDRSRLSCPDIIS